jgi:hypothetical protein
VTVSAWSNGCGRRRLLFLAHALVTIAVGLAVHLRGQQLPNRARDAVGDALWAAMIAFGMGMLLPRASSASRGWLALGICCAVEASQLLHTPWLDALRATRGGHLVLGSGFDARDFAAYAAGVAVAIAYTRRFISACDDSMP